jgi:hypothetical protein
LSSAEVKQAEFSSSWRHLVDNPLNLPLTAVQWLILTIIPHHGNTVTRAASPIFGVLALVAFVYVLRRWYGLRTAIYGTLIFGFCSWFLHVSRYASPDVLYLWAVPTLLAVLIAWDRYHELRKTTYIAMLVLSILAYIPGVIWLILVAMLFQLHLIKNSWVATKGWLWRAVFILVPLVALAPLIIGLIRTPSLIQTWLGLPHNFGSLESIARGLLHSVSFFVYKGPNTPELWLVRVPILSFFGIVLAVLGTLFYAKHFKAPRTQLLLIFFILGAVLFALGGPVTISILVPVVYLVIAAGFGYLLHEWLHVFPRNPLARSIGFGLMALAVALTCLYHVRAYYVAWPHNSATQAAFHRRD